MNHTAMRRFLPLLMILAILLAGCGREEIAPQPTGSSGTPVTESVTVPDETMTQPASTEPEAPAMTFPAEPITEPAKAPTQATEPETAPQEPVPTETEAVDDIPEESYTEGENELPAVPF